MTSDCTGCCQDEVTGVHAGDSFREYNAEIYTRGISWVGFIPTCDRNHTWYYIINRIDLAIGKDAIQRVEIGIQNGVVIENIKTHGAVACDAVDSDSVGQIG